MPCVVKCFIDIQLVNNYRVPNKHIFIESLHGHIRDRVYDRPFRKKLTKGERVQSLCDITKLLDSRAE